MKKETAVRSAHVLFKGMVQGVGFRFTVHAQAQDLKVKGWIKNLPNGDVELMVEQTKEVLEELLFRLNRYFSKYIHSAQVNWQAAKGEFKDFQIRF